MLWFIENILINLIEAGWSQRKSPTKEFDNSFEIKNNIEEEKMDIWGDPLMKENQIIGKENDEAKDILQESKWYMMPNF